MNSIIQSGIGNDPNGIRRLYMDNRYTCAALFILLHEKFDILCSGTMHVDCHGWPKQLMTLTKSAKRGPTLRKYDATNKILCMQWMDNKVVSLTSSLAVSGLVRQLGSTMLNLEVKQALKAY